MDKEELLHPTNDYVFGRIFGYKGNENITKGLLESITNVKYQKVEIASSVATIKDLQDDKMGILDVRATADDNTIFDIEMQVAKNQNIADRIIWYWSALYHKSIDSGVDYIKTKKTIAILIADFKIDILENIPNFHTSWHIREDEFSKIILTEKLELHIIELSKLAINNDQLVNQNKLLKWSKFILNPEGGIDMEDEDIKQAKKVLEEISQDAEEQEKARLRDKYVREINSSRNEGYEDGVLEGKLATARNMLADGCDIKLIMQYTQLPENEILKLMDE